MMNRGVLMYLQKAYIFGAGKRGKKIFNHLKQAETEIIGFIDNSISKQGT